MNVDEQAQAGAPLLTTKHTETMADKQEEQQSTMRPVECEVMRREERQKFIIVLHGWFVSSNGFEIHEIEVGNIKEAREKAYALKGKSERTFNKCAVKVIPLADNERVEWPWEREDCYKLSIWERITGRVQAA